MKQLCTLYNNGVVLKYVYIYVFLWLQGSLPQSRQSARLFLQSSELEHPPPPPQPPHPQASLSTSHFGFGNGGTLACGRGAGRVPIRARRQTLRYSRYICTLWSRGIEPQSFYEYNIEPYTCRSSLVSWSQSCLSQVDRPESPRGTCVGPSCTYVHTMHVYSILSKLTSLPSSISWRGNRAIRR